MFHSSYESEVEASAKTVFEEDGGTTAVQASLRDDGHPVTQQVGLVHVVGGHDHSAPCNRGTQKDNKEWINRDILYERRMDD